MFRSVAIATALIVTVMMALIAFAQPDTAARALRNVVVVDTMVLGTLWLARRGQVRAASWIYVWVLVLLIAANAPPVGGIRSPGVQAYFVLVMMAGMLLGERAGIAMAVVCATIGLGLVVAERTSFAPIVQGDYNAVVRWLLLCMYMGVALLAMRVATGRIKKSLADAQRELAERNQTEAERERLVLHHGERIKELRLLHDASRLLQHASGADRLLLAELVARMPAAWLHVDDAYARIALGDIEVTSPDWHVTPWILTATFTTSDGDGTIQVAYRHEHLPADEGPFLAEERALIDSLAEMLRTHIERYVVERRREAAEAQLRQAQKMEAIGTLAGGIAHDFNNVLTAIGGNADLAALEGPQEGPVAESIQGILKAHARARDLVRRILMFARQEETSREVMALAPVVDEALQLLRATLPASTEIQSSVAPDLPRVRADATQLHQVVMNLGTNAAYAMRERGGTLTVALDAVTVDTDAISPTPQLVSGRYVRMTIADTGSGMSPEVRERLFEPFFTTKGQAGTGLGLSVVHGIVREHGGTIAVTSEPGVGTTFVIHLPAEDDTAAATPAHGVSIVRGAGQHILYVDDEADLCHLMSRTFIRLGYRCTGFTDPEVALHEFRAAPHDFDVVVSDLQMPAMSGLDLARAVRTVRADTPIALISGYSPDHIITDPDVRTVTWLAKPATLQELALTLHRLVRDGGTGG